MSTAALRLRAKPALAPLALAAKDLAVEARSRELLDAALVGALAMAFVAGATLATAAPAPEATAAALWGGALLALALPLARSFTGEADRGTLDLLLLLPVDRAALLLGKVLSNLALALAAEAALLAAYALLFGQGLQGLGTLAPVVLLGSLGLAAGGSLTAALAAQARAREALLPVLLFPLMLPVLLAALHASVHALRGGSVGEIAQELELLAGYDLLLLAVGAALFERAVQG